jgi:hypothetical protein
MQESTPKHTPLIPLRYIGSPEAGREPRQMSLIGAQASSFPQLSIFRRSSMMKTKHGQGQAGFADALPASNLGFGDKSKVNSNWEPVNF